MRLTTMRIYLSIVSSPGAIVYLAHALNTDGCRVAGGAPTHRSIDNSLSQVGVEVVSLRPTSQLAWVRG